MGGGTEWQIFRGLKWNREVPPLCVGVAYWDGLISLNGTGNFSRPIICSVLLRGDKKWQIFKGVKWNQEFFQTPNVFGSVAGGGEWNDFFSEAWNGTGNPKPQMCFV